MNSGKRYCKALLITLLALALPVFPAACASKSPAPVPGTGTVAESILRETDGQPTPETNADPTEAPENKSALSDTETATNRETGENTEMKTLKLKIGDTQVAVDWEDNESVAALAELVKNGPLTIRMSMYGGFEQVGSLGTSLPRNDTQTSTEAGDIVLYSGDRIVVFYGSNEWAYTRLGRVSDKSASQMKELLGKGDVSITIGIEG